MESVSKGEGRTVLFVSHNMNAIEQLCSRAMLLDRGGLYRNTDNVRDVVVGYLYGDGLKQSSSWTHTDDTARCKYFQPRRMYAGDGMGREIAMPVKNDSELWIYIEGEIEEPDPALQIGYALYDEEQRLLYWSVHTDSPEDKWPQLAEGMVRLRAKLPPRLFNEGDYRIELISALYCSQWLCEPGKNNVPSIKIIIQGGLSDSPYWMNRRPGILAPVLDWERIV